jgi:hypothetical protein
MSYKSIEGKTITQRHLHEILDPIDDGLKALVLIMDGMLSCLRLDQMDAEHQNLVDFINATLADYQAKIHSILPDGPVCPSIQAEEAEEEEEEDEDGEGEGK